jgi:hypothetical protein
VIATIVFLAYFQTPAPAKKESKKEQSLCPIHGSQVVIPQIVCHSQPTEVSPSIKVTVGDEFPISIQALTKFSSIMMTTILLYCGYNACQEGNFECDMQKFPDISHVMGHEPLNKLYAIMLTFYAFQKQAYVRAFYSQLKALPNEQTANVHMLYFAALSCVFGPMIGFFDVYYNMQVHCTVTAFFVIGELGYIFTMIGVVSKNKDFFKGVPHSASMISKLELCRIFIAIEAVVSIGTKIYGIKIGAWSAFIEWTLFICTFYIFTVLSDLMPFQLKVVKQE